MKERALLIGLCCLAPLAALATTLFLNIPALLTVAVALAVLVPASFRLLAGSETGWQDAEKVDSMRAPTPDHPGKRQASS